MKVSFYAITARLLSWNLEVVSSNVIRNDLVDVKVKLATVSKVQ